MPSFPCKRRFRRHRRINLSYPQYGSQNDTSGPLFSLYSQMVEEGDKNISKRHQKDAEGILLFIGLFSATLAALITVSIQDLRPGPQDTSPFSPPTYAQP
ncbi:hypothetical protein BGY98DRAFT_1048318 [Russula aff. rugulosa BPL654]|nr:hypothetical protein BGY98DRAFT_1048318 [Russula aff. rugulosa BPL654]